MNKDIDSKEIETGMGMFIRQTVTKYFDFKVLSRKPDDYLLTDLT